MRDALEPTPDPGWILGHEGYNVLTESAVESRFALGNGFLGMRAARSVSRGPTWLSWLGYIRWASWPRCYVAGLFDIPNTEPPVPALVPVADWSRVRVLLDGEPLLAREGEVLAGTRRLDLRRGVLLSSWTHRNPAGITVTGRELRLLSRADCAAGLQLMQFALDRDGVEVTLEASFAMAGLGDGRLGHGADATRRGSRGVAHRGHRQGRGDGGRRVAAACRRSARPRPALPAALGVALALRGRPDGGARPPGRGSPGRHAGGRSRPARA
jgi:hypothetical protein